MRRGSRVCGDTLQSCEARLLRLKAGAVSPLALTTSTSRDDLSLLPSALSLYIWLSPRCLQQAPQSDRVFGHFAIAEYVAPYHGERSHQGLGNEIPSGAPVQREGVIQDSERLGGFLKYYHRAGA